MMNTITPNFRNPHENYSGRPPWRPNYPRQFQQWNQTSNPRFNETVYSQANSNEFWCETCDRGFPREDILEKHKQQHQKCNIDGCQFIAHPKVITKHIQMQHSTGLYKKIAVLNNPEEIKKWIEERKKKYPTKENVQKKDAETKEKINRGEKMGMKGKRFEEKNKSNNMKRQYPFNNNHNDKQTIRNNLNENKPRQRKVDNTIPTTTDNKKLKPFAGIQSLLLEDEETENHCENDINSDNDLIEDIDIDHQIINDQNPRICGALSSLICNYGSSDEEESPESPVPNGTINSLKECKDKVKPNEIRSIVKTNQIEDDDSGPEEVKSSNSKEDTNVIEGVTSKPVIDKKMSRKSELNNVKNSRKVIPKRRPRKLPSTLLQKLLRNEIKQERNKVLQCIRYIVEHNYFDM